MPIDHRFPYNYCIGDLPDWYSAHSHTSPRESARTGQCNGWPTVWPYVPALPHSRYGTGNLLKSISRFPDLLPIHRYLPPGAALLSALLSAQPAARNILHGFFQSVFHNMHGAKLSTACFFFPYCPHHNYR